jgi:hypothetical protein
MSLHDNYISGPQSGDSNQSGSAVQAHAQSHASAPALAEVAPGYADLEKSPFEVAWDILCDENAWVLTANKVKVLDEELGLTDPNDLEYLDDDELKNLADNLKLIRKKKFLAQFADDN